MLPQSETAVGIDVAKDWLDVAFPEGKVERVDNSAPAIGRLARRLQKEKLQTVGLEPTGGYERAAVALLNAAGLQVRMVDSWRCRQFAKARGTRAKTDPLDARMIREFLLAHPCRPFPQPGVRQSELTAWVREIARAEADIRRLLNRDQHCELEPIRRRHQAEIATLRQTIALAEQEIDAILADEPELAAKAAIITSVPGLGDKTARVLLAECPEIGSLSARSIAALCGLAPYQRDSGKRRLPAHVQAGRSALKRTGYLAAFAAVRHNAWAKALYADLRGRGKPAKVALIAIARRLVTILNAMIRDHTVWHQPKAEAR